MVNKPVNNINGYAVSSAIKAILQEEGYVVLKVKDSGIDLIKAYETIKVSQRGKLPQGADLVVDANKVREYERLIIIEEDF